jgi:single-strand DNA-binding protein
MNLNKVQIVGRVTKDPEMRTTPSGSSVAIIGVATNFKYKLSDGQLSEKVSFHTCVAYGKLASEVVAKYCVKGQEVYIGGRLDYQEWTKPDGTKGNKTQIIIEDFQLGQKPKQEQEKPTQVEQATQNKLNEEDEIKIEDIPF